ALFNDIESGNPIAMPQENANERRLTAIHQQIYVPSECICPLSQQIMTDPVSPQNFPEHVFERSWIELVLSRNPQNPLNRQPLEIGDLVTRTDVARRIHQYLCGLENTQHPILNHPAAYQNR